MIEWLYRILMVILIAVVMGIVGVASYGAGYSDAGDDYYAHEQKMRDYEEPTMNTIFPGPRQWDI